MGLHPVEQSGQTKCYDFAGSEISCDGTGQDAEFQSGVDLPVPRFHDNGNGTILDNLTGLVWLQDADCFSSRDWQQALDNANSLAAPSCGLSDGSRAGDWRLPNVKELQSLLDFGQVNPSLSQGHPFLKLSSDYYWSSTTRADAFGPADAHALNVHSGFNSE